MIVNNNKYIDVNINNYTKSDYFKKIMKLKYNKIFPKKDKDFFIKLILNN